MAFETEIIVRLDQHLGIDRTVRIVTNGATLAHGFVFEDKRPSLIAMTFGAGLIEPRNAESAGWFHDVSAMWIVTLYTVHLAFDYGMMLRHGKLRVRLEVTLKTGSRIFAGIQNELAFAATHFDVFAAWAVTGFAPALSDARIGSKLHTRMRAGREDSDIVGVTLKTGLVTNVIGAGNGGAHHDRSGCCRTGVGHAQNQKP